MAVSSKKNKPTSGAEINLGANIIKIKDTATVRTIKKIYNKSRLEIARLVNKVEAIRAVKILPITYEGTKFF